MPAHGLPRVALWRWRRNPLRRRTDRIQGWIGLAVLLVVLSVAPAAACLAGDAAHRHYAAIAQLQSLTRQYTTAVLVHDAPRHPEPGSAEEKKTRYEATVRFTGPDGRPRTARTEVRPGLPAGSGVPVWVGPDGHLTDPPLTAVQVRGRSKGWAVIAVLTVGVTGAVINAVAGLVLRRRNLAAWEAAWAETAPRWTSRS
ncbi:hypothetical protein [Streptomyces sp. DH24]|uniref:Rv1733c family protein n=1 Tax=Streptomyces sp. DH24 TaxID=3040123 RepID=UPI0024433ECE|nr:hypothetical protein [Streptomyces sp. DH24]MDG9717274.1 hypothetical protein [Streptomyces sp. DH24]